MADELTPETLHVVRRPWWRGTRLMGVVRRGQRWSQAVAFARRHNAALPATARTLWFSPMWPHPETRMAAMLAAAGMRIGHGIHADEPSIAWFVGTWLPAGQQGRLPPDAINRDCVDTSKGLVDRTWEEVAGYGVSVDPLTTNGPLVVKSELNSRHDGRLVTGPLAERQPGWVYERYVDSLDGAYSVSLRTTFVAGRIVNVLRCWRSATDWLAHSEKLLPATAQEVYSPEEVAQLTEFVRRLKLDYGELDVLRDRHSGRIYVLDCNPTAYGLTHISPDVERQTTKAMADALAMLIEERWPRR